MNRFFIYCASIVLCAQSLSFAGDLVGRNAIVTGGSRGIGEASVYALAKEGANVAIIANNSIEDAEELVKKIKDYGVDAFAYRCDVSNPDEVNRMVDEVVKRWKSVDILVNNAGVSVCKPAEDLTYEDWQRIIDVNLTGVFLCAQAAGKKMIEQGTGGSIINISSMCGHIVVTPQKSCHYHASKGGVGMLTKSLAVEWAEYGIRVNAISPGYIKTKMIEPGREFFPLWIERTPMKTIGDPEDIAEAVVYFASPKSKFATGADLIIDGGYSCP